MTPVPCHTVPSGCGRLLHHRAKHRTAATLDEDRNEVTDPAGHVRVHVFDDRVNRRGRYLRELLDQLVQDLPDAHPFTLEDVAGWLMKSHVRNAMAVVAQVASSVS